MKFINVVFVLLGALSQIDAQNVKLTANQIDFTDSLPDILVNGLLSGATNEQKLLLNDTAVANAIQSLRQTLAQVVQYNLDAIANIAQTTNRCAIAPYQQTRKIIETARDSSLTCLQGLRANLQANEAYLVCLQTVFPIAKRDIDALQPVFAACLTSTTATTTPSNETAST